MIRAMPQCCQQWSALVEATEQVAASFL